MPSLRTFVIVIEVRTVSSFLIYHIEYDKELVMHHTEYLFFQDMLRSNLRMNICTFLPIMFKRGWTVVSQSQNANSLFYTLAVDLPTSCTIVPAALPAAPPVHMEINT